MESQPTAPLTRWVAIYQNDRFTSFQSLSGYFFSMPERDGYVCGVPAGASDSDLGGAMRTALNCSRFVLPDGTDQAFYDPEIVEGVFYMRLDQLQHDFGYNSRRRLLKGMKYCTVTMRLGEIRFEPTRHVRSIEWQDLRMAPIVVEDDVDDLALGAAVRLAMNTCTG
jgi:CDI immunity protein